jgi:hypothetical protein
MLLDVSADELWEVLAEWILNHYDYTVARLFLSMVQERSMDGPYIVSSPQGLHGTNSLPDPYFLQDLS